MASRKEQKEALRRERLAREQAAAQSAARKRLIGIVVAAILVLGIAGAIAVVLLTGDGDGASAGDGGGASVSFPDAGELPERQEADLARAVEAGGCTTERVRAQGAGQHTTEPVQYESEPPAIGPHHPDWPEDDIYETAPQTERVVHTLEHGRILIWVRPDASEELLAQVRALYEEDPYHVIVVPREELREPIAASAWVGDDTGHVLRCPRPNPQMWDAIRAFRNDYRDRAPEFVP